MKIGVSSGILILAIAAVFLDRNGILPFLLLSAIIHELGHFLTLNLLGARVGGVEVGLGGARALVPGMARLSYKKEFAAVAAGPAVNLAAALVLSRLAAKTSAEWMFVAAGTNLVLGLFNLLPMRFLDGGRLAQIIAASRVGPVKAEHICALLSWVTLSLVLAGALYMGIAFGLYAPLFSAVLYLLGNILSERLG